LDEGQVVDRVVFMPHQNAPEVLQPGEQALNLPASVVAPQCAPILGWRLLSPAPMGRNEFNPVGRQFRVERIA
jgi:hypothetical protein